MSAATLLPHPTARGPWLAWLCAALALLAWLPAARLDGWAYDDREVLEQNPVVEGQLPALEAFERDYWDHRGAAGHYRPLATLSLRADYALHGMAPRGFHLTNALLHAAVVMLAGIALVLLSGGANPRPFPWIGLGVFAVHPALADSVAWISGRTSMLSALGGLVGVVLLLAWTTPRRDETVGRLARVAFAAALGTLLALLGKEDGLVFAPLLAFVAWRHSRRALSAAVGGCVVAILAYGFLRYSVYGSPTPSAPFAPLADASFLERIKVGGRAVVESVRLLVAPVAYPPNYERSEVFRDVEPWIAIYGWAALAVIAFVGVRRLREPRGRLAGASALLCVASFLPLVQLVPAGVLFAPRFLYLPLLFGCVALDALVRLLPSRAAVATGIVAIAAFLPLAWQRSGVYRDRTSFYEEQLRHVPDDPTAYNELALAREEAGDVPGAVELWKKALKLDPSYGRPWSNLGRLALADGDVAEAERCFRRAIEFGPGNVVARINLGAVLLRQERWAEAASVYRIATELAPGMVAAWRGLAKASWRLDDTYATEFAASSGLDLAPEDKELRELFERAALIIGY
ncbi:MAG: tetratricopeptide repeat protein [Planctomycetota bacterium]|nr:tetratricopeptide repeat protein [Planctomycetota bacterium]